MLKRKIREYSIKEQRYVNAIPLYILMQDFDWHQWLHSGSHSCKHFNEVYDLKAGYMHTKGTCLIIFVSKQKHFIIFTAKNCIREKYFCACMNSRSILHTDFCATTQLKVHAHVHMQLLFLTRLCLLNKALPACTL